MHSIYTISVDPFWSQIEARIPEEKFMDLCGCIFCWNYRYTRNCAKCEKMFCDEHMENHLCFKEKPTTTATVMVGAVAYTVATECTPK